MTKHVSLEAIIDATNRIAFTNSDTRAIIDYIKMSNSKGYDISVHTRLQGSVKEALQDGFIMLQSYSLDMDFVFINANGGKGLLGGQKRSVLSFVGSAENDQFLAGTTFKILAIALTSINNIYRQYA